MLDEVLPSVQRNIGLRSQQQRTLQQQQSGNYHRSSGSNSEGHSSGHEGGGATASAKKRKYPLITEPPFTRKRTTITMLNGGYKGLDSSSTSHNPYLHHHSAASLLGPQSSITSSATSSHQSPPAIATLANLGNTCYLNSVLYALRFAPTFLHRLHHLVADLESACAGSAASGGGSGSNSLQQQLQQQRRLKSASLGRNVAPGLSGVGGNRSTSTRDLLAIGAGGEVAAGSIGMPKTKVQVVTEKLHELFLAMRIIEDRKKDMTEAYQPIEFLEAVRNANYIFEGNQQQDAHELLVYLLDNIRETCNLLYSYHTYPDLTANYSNGSLPTTTSTPSNAASSNPSSSSTAINTGVSSSTKNTWWSKKTTKKSTASSGKDGAGRKGTEKKDVINEEVGGGGGADTDTEGGGEDVGGDSGKSGGSTPIMEKKRYNFLAEDFEGITLRRTKCLECESVTERKELFYDIPVPINCNEDEAERQKLNPSDVYRLACVTTEKLCDANKYLCELCQHYNEASREVSFAKLPNILVLQLKRFAASAGGLGGAGVVQKVHADMPTPLKLSCFCEGCCRGETDHKYRLCCVIMHLGGTLQSGHYMAYVRVQGGGCGDFTHEYVDCSRDLPKGTMSASTSEKSLNFLKRFKPTAKSSFESSKHGSNQHNQSPRVCKSQQCCGIKINRSAVEGTVMNAVNASNGYGRHYDYESCDDDANASAKGDDNDIWLECDDDNVRSITKFELQKLLSGKVNPTSTPYLLFYAKIMPDA